MKGRPIDVLMKMPSGAGTAMTYIIRISFQSLVQVLDTIGREIEIAFLLWQGYSI